MAEIDGKSFVRTPNMLEYLYGAFDIMKEPEKSTTVSSRTMNRKFVEFEYVDLDEIGDVVG